MGGEYSGTVQNVFRTRFGPEFTLKKSMLPPQTGFPIFWKTEVLSFHPKLTFWVLNLKIRPVEYVHMDHTGHFGFSYVLHFDM